MVTLFPLTPRHLHGGLGLLARRGILGDPVSSKTFWVKSNEFSKTARRAIKQGAPGTEIFIAADQLIQAIEPAFVSKLVAHGIGLVSQEASRAAGDGLALLWL
jgi:hypothetical protein